MMPTCSATNAQANSTAYLKIVLLRKRFLCFAMAILREKI